MPGWLIHFQISSGNALRLKLIYPPEGERKSLEENEKFDACGRIEGAFTTLVVPLLAWEWAGRLRACSPIDARLRA